MEGSMTMYFDAFFSFFPCPAPSLHDSLVNVCIQHGDVPVPRVQGPGWPGRKQLTGEISRPRNLSKAQGTSHFIHDAVAREPNGRLADALALEFPQSQSEHVRHDGPIIS